jgi:predicted PurR-regulated permease PerM
VLSDSLIVIVVTVDFVVDMPRIRTALYRLVPHTRRPRAILIGDEVFAKVGAYVLGNVLISVITGAATFVWLTVFGVPTRCCWPASSQSLISCQLWDRPSPVSSSPRWP